VVGGAAARTHTGTLAGSASIQESLWRQHNVLLAEDLEEFLALVELCSRCPIPSGARLGVLTISGGERLMLADAAESVGLTLSDIGEDTASALKDLLPSYAAVSNPLDTTGAGLVEGDSRVHAAAARLLANDPSVDILLMCQDSKNGWVQRDQQATLFWDAIRSAWEAISDIGKPVVVISPTTGQVDERARLYLDAHNIPHLFGLRTGMAALAQFVHSYCGVGVQPSTPAVHTGRAGSTAAAMSGYDALRYLADRGVPVWPVELARSEEEAVRMAKRAGYPVVLKIDAPGLLHRTEVDGVRLNLMDEESVRLAWRALAAQDERESSPCTVLVQRMAPGGVELFVGGVWDEQFGPVVLCGAGGVLAEFVGDVGAGLAPLDRELAMRLLAATRVERLLKGWRGAPPCDTDAVVDVLIGVSKVLAERGVLAIDVNPLIAHSSGVALVDAKLIVRDGGVDEAGRGSR
jgi:acetate---CoA ligase (ADP-forming)